MHEPSAGRSKVLTYRLLLCPCINIKPEFVSHGKPQWQDNTQAQEARCCALCWKKCRLRHQVRLKIAPLAHGRQSCSKYHQASKS